MMVDLGKYAVEVLSAYAASITILVAIVWQSIARSAKVKRQLQEFEKARQNDA